ncbi:MAG: hypothetical protein LBJ88_02075 [Campylobacteraceae bacterium]|jgi:SAM-dependent methyltransferase|nr:hypothetical protein [Campylobacteraceae bacterium]
MNKYTTLKTAFLKNTAATQQNRTFWLLITCTLVFMVLFSCFIVNNYINILLSADFTYLRFAFLLVFLAGIICAVNPKKFLDIGCGFGFVAAVFGIKQSLALWAIYRFSETKEFVAQGKPFSNFISCFFNVSEINDKCVFRANTLIGDIFSSYTNVISQNDFTNMLKIHVYVFVAISTLFCMLYLCRKIKI